MDIEKQKIVILAEDDRTIARLIIFKLEKEGFKVIHFLNGESVVDTVSKILPDIVILDVMMPIQDGISILKEIKASPKTKHIPVVILSAKGQEKDIIKGMEIGASDYISKPFSPSELIVRIKRILS
ncbi:response regulator [Candidatus Atribacteria bacterium MT.SAG.1]|nr:response regulator [Candidatus Atribacteria bacterium MT.SAG.1]